MSTLSLRQAWMALIVGVLALALVPAGLALDRRLASELEQRARSDLAMAPKILADRNANRADALMMRAKDLSGVAGLAEAVAEGDGERALSLARRTASAPGEAPLLVGAEGRVLAGIEPAEDAVRATRDGEMPVRFRYREGRLFRYSLAPLAVGGRWVGAAGVVSPVDEALAGTLAGLTRSEVVFLGPGGAPLVTTGGVTPPAALADSASRWAVDGGVREVRASDGEAYWAAVARLGDAGSVAFLRDVSEELQLLPALRRSALVAVLVALAVALLLGGVLSARMARPVRALADASQRLADGDFEAPLPASRIREIQQVGRAFGGMRAELRQTIDDLRDANRELEERQARLQALQAELIQRDRLAATGRLITELAHEIRNPVASVRNCLEIIHRRLDDDSELREFSDMAVDELLRMHRLAEQMLDANRPVDPDAEACRPAEVAGQVVELARTAGDGHGVTLDVAGDGDVEAAIGPDALKQVLLNLVENAREAMEDGGAGGDAGHGAGAPAEREAGADGAAGGREGARGRIEIRVRRAEPAGSGDVVVEVLDDGPGLDEEVRGRVFDPFFTTKDEVHGVGLGLFVAQGLVRRHGGSLRASNRPEGGARFTIRLPAADPPDGASEGAPADAGGKGPAAADRGAAGDGPGAADGPAEGGEA